MLYLPQTTYTLRNVKCQLYYICDVHMSLLTCVNHGYQRCFCLYHFSIRIGNCFDSVNLFSFFFSPLHVHCNYFSIVLSNVCH